MQILQPPKPNLFFFPSHLKTLQKPYRPHSTISPALHLPRRPLSGTPPFSGDFAVKSFSSDEYPVDDDYQDLFEKYARKDKETEEEARRRNWIERGWAPWEEILTPEGRFARASLNEGEEVPLKSQEAIEAFRMMSPKYRRKKMEEMGLTEDEFYAKQFEIKGEIPEPLKTTWDGPLVVRLVPPRDWPPRGWEVDRKELELIREAHKIPAVINMEDVEKASTNTDDLCLDRYKVFLEQYKEWVEYNKDRLEEESYKYDQDYHPGRRKRGKDYEEGMYELPFYYPGQAKRDPYRFRFPIEMRFVDPNIDHLIFNRFEFPPIFHRDEDTNPDELRRDCGRPPLPVKDPGIKVEEEALLFNHPYVERLWQLHNAEQLILDDMEANPDKYEGKKLSELTDDEEFDKENSVEYTKVKYNNSIIPKVILKTSVKELDLEAALAEREHHNKLRREAEERGETYKVTKLRRNIEMDEYDLIQWRRSLEEREALLRDISCRQALGLPLQEPGKFLHPRFWKDEYDPANPLYRYDYWGEPKNSEKSMQERMTDAHNKRIVGNSPVWYEMSYEDAVKQQRRREKEAQAYREMQKEAEEADEDQSNEENDDELNDFDDFIISSFNAPSSYVEAHPVNGTESRMPDEGIFEN
ncbi:protein PLASTID TRANSCRIPTIONALLY ACTIVE 10 isoform X2 [Malania oleifera]|uniref:protein PLASTID TRANSCRIPTIONALLY ACTIVE 10 isoform X2 n=1 Tax=Malania oleifera TaxID=397392 RepID=UPI0025AE2B7F|nr:protein PLASTID TRANSCRIPTIONALLY ACTIVE 10 isoform X2 [Malania oleifera]